MAEIFRTTVFCIRSGYGHSIKSTFIRTVQYILRKTVNLFLGSIPEVGSLRVIQTYLLHKTLDNT
jgi:hypothetical protein